MTSQREAQRKEDLLLDLYKLNAYIPNDASFADKALGKG